MRSRFRRQQGVHFFTLNLQLPGRCEPRLPLDMIRKSFRHFRTAIGLPPYPIAKIYMRLNIRVATAKARLRRSRLLVREYHFDSNEELAT